MTVHTQRYYALAQKEAQVTLKIRELERLREKIRSEKRKEEELWWKTFAKA